MTTARKVRVAIDDLSEMVKAEAAMGFGIACIYVKEQTDYVARTLEVIMISGDEVLRLSSILTENTYQSLAKDFPAADVYEREMFEMSNIVPLGHPDLRPLKLRKRLEGAYPMQKAEIGSPKSRPISLPGNGITGEGLFDIPVGPIHAGVIEPGHFRFTVAGEPILKMHAYFGYTYRGIERMMEVPQRKDMTRLAERISGDNAIAHSLAYLQAVERNTEIPVRARYIRTIYAELERMYYLLNGMSGIALDTALSVPAAKGFMLKERILRLNESISGHRMLWGALRPGGVRTDLERKTEKEIETEMMNMKVEVDGLFDIMVASTSFMDRAETTGVLNSKDASELRVVGPAARASGIEYDVRKNHPYAAYGLIGMKTVTHTGGDVYARLKVKKNEILESISIVDQCLNNMEEGPTLCEMEFRDGFSMGLVESPRGELLHCMHVVDGNIWRYKIRDPSFPNWPAIELAVIGNIVPDFPLINKSFDLSYSGNDL